ncbi:MAG: N-acetylmuramoyl-L-alanine amidase [Flavobacteriales bacterium MED-G22]|nr:MAG: N-acetylmuramoyl-L-alanine amidase [Flavobacteriales bacterium MED-G22]
MKMDFNAYCSLTRRFRLMRLPSLISSSTLLFLLVSTLFYSVYAQDKTFTVVLDAGHGGRDTGNRGNGYYEKKIALNIALTIGSLLEKQNSIKVIYTRKKDVFVDLIERANIANKADADLFISIHCDAFSQSSVYGAGTFVLGLHANDRNFQIAQKENSVIFLEEDYEQKYDGFDPNNPESVISLLLMQETYLDQSIVAANTIQQSFISNLSRKDRTVKQAGFVVLKYTYMPSVLVEAGFLTNPKEGAYLNSTKGQQQISSTIADAVINYRNFLYSSVSSENPIENNKPKSELVKNVKKDISTIYFSVQIAASKKSIATKPYNFKGLKPIQRQKEGKIYRYYYSQSKTIEGAKKLQTKAQKKGFKGAFLVAFKDGKKVDIKSVLP